MKDRIVAAIHRQRAKYAKRFNYDVSAIGDAIRQCQAESGDKFVNRSKTNGKRSRRNAITSK